MVALRNACAPRYVLLCHVFCFWHFATRTLQFSALPPNSKLLKDVERNEVTNWVREQICDLEYYEDIANKVVDALSGYRRKGLMEVSEENLRKALANEFSASADCIAIAQSLYNRIQKDIAQPQPVSRQGLVLAEARVCCVFVFFKYVKQGFCFCGCFAWFQVQSDIPENVKAFAQALDDAELEGQILKTAKGSFKLEQDSEIWNETKFYVRDCYKQIADIMFKKKPHRMSLLGSSGIGKSNFMVYLIWRRFQDSELKDFPVFLHRDNIILQLEKDKEPKKVDADILYSAPAKALYIMDADIHEKQWVFCQSLWITSARRPDTAAFNSGDFFKQADSCGGQFFMPPWALEEMLHEKVKDLHKLNAEVVKKRFGLFFMALRGLCYDWTRQGQSMTRKGSWRPCSRQMRCNV